jgi:HD-like signal output (HDOD) protein
LARAWYRQADKSMLPLLMSSAFLMELGKLVASLRVIGAGNAERFSQEIAQESSFEEAEQKYVGMSSYEIAASMFEHWNFEPALIEALRGISDPHSANPYSRALRVIVQAVNLKGEFSEAGMAEALETIEKFGLNRAAFEEAVMALKTSQE